MKIFRCFLLLSLFLELSVFAACPFCNQDVINKQFIHETDCTVTLYCLTPATKGNILIIPKRHIEKFEQLTAYEMQTVQKEINLFSSVFTNVYGISEFVILQKNGKNAGQSVAHLHFHMIPASKPFDDTIYTAFHLREKISDEEMKLRTQELQDFLLQSTIIQGAGMDHIIEHQKEKFFIGLELRTTNEECSSAMPAHKERFFKENILSKIPNKVNGNILALYTDYEGDYTMPYSWILGCEVSSLDQVPEGLVGKIIPKSKYAVFTTQGEFPRGLIAAWQNIWKSGLPRSYTSDFEVYRSDFDPQQNPEVKIYIAIEDSHSTK